MTSIATAEYRAAPATNETRTYGAGLPVRAGAFLSGLDKIALSLVIVMALGPLAMGTLGAHIMAI